MIVQPRALLRRAIAGKPSIVTRNSCKVYCSATKQIEPVPIYPSEGPESQQGAANPTATAVRGNPHSPATASVPDAHTNSQQPSSSYSDEARQQQMQQQRAPDRPYIVTRDCSAKGAASKLMQRIEMGKPIKVSCREDCMLKALQILALTRTLTTRRLGLDLAFQSFTPALSAAAQGSGTIFVFAPCPPAPATSHPVSSTLALSYDLATFQANITSRLNRFGHTCLNDIHRNEDAVLVLHTLLLARKEALMRASDILLYPEPSLKTIDGEVHPSVDILIRKALPPRQEPRPRAARAAPLGIAAPPPPLS